MAEINKSILNKNNFRLLIDRIPTVEYYVQTVNIPGLTMNETIMSSRIGLDGYFPGDKIIFDTLDITFLVDEDLENFKEMYDWMDAIVPVKDTSAYSNLVGGTSTSTNVTANKAAGMEQYSDITLVMNTNKNIPNKYFRFHDCFPLTLGALELQSGADAEPVTSSVTFRFSYYDIANTS